MIEKQKKQPAELHAILQRIFEKDQAVGHNQAHACLVELQSLEQDFSGTDCEDAYWDSVSREYLHIGQAAGQRGDVGTATASVKLALEAARKVKPDFYTESDWLAYLEATIAYFESNVERIRSLVSICKLNQGVVHRLIQGLEQRGSPDYLKDY